MKTYLLRFKTATFSQKGRNAWAAKRAAAALLEVSPKQIAIA